MREADRPVTEPGERPRTTERSGCRASASACSSEASACPCDGAGEWGGGVQRALDSEPGEP